jgi:hypothetical protein
MPCYLDGGVTNTIPSSYARYRAKYFKNGRAGHGKRLGSKIYELNTFAWQFGRPMKE